MQITGIILAGGKSSRMGTDKALIKIDEKNLLEISIELCKSISENILISSNSEIHKNFGFEITKDEIENCGPIGGIYSCLKKSQTTWNLVVSVDSPYVETQYIQYLVSEIDNSNAVVPIHSKGKEPLIAMYHKSCLDIIEEMIHSGNFKMHNLLGTIETKYVDSNAWCEQYPGLFYNINRPEDL